MRNCDTKFCVPKTLREISLSQRPPLISSSVSRECLHSINSCQTFQKWKVLLLEAFLSCKVWHHGLLKNGKFHSSGHSLFVKPGIVFFFPVIPFGYPLSIMGKNKIKMQGRSLCSIKHTGACITKNAQCLTATLHKPLFQQCPHPCA